MKENSSPINLAMVVIHSIIPHKRSIIEAL